MKSKTVYISYAAIIAALYVVLTAVSALFGLDKGVIQFRLSEALTFLPIFTGAAVPGLFIGCIISNLIFGSLPIDILLGSIATLIGASAARLFFRKAKFLSPLPTIISNTLIVPFILKYAYNTEQMIPYLMLTVFIGEFVCAGILGNVLMRYLPQRLTDQMAKDGNMQS